MEQFGELLATLVGEQGEENVGEQGDRQPQLIFGDNREVPDPDMNEEVGESSSDEEETNANEWQRKIPTP